MIGSWSWKNILYGIWLVIFAWSLLVANIIIFSPLGLQIVRALSPQFIYAIAIVGPWSIGGWLLLVAIFFWFPAILAAWVGWDAIKFRRRGTKTWPILWALGTILPTSIIVLPLYLIRSRIFWRNKLNRSHESQDAIQTSPVDKRTLTVEDAEVR